MRKYLRGNSGMRFLAILTAVALTLGSVDVTALASAAGQNAAEQTAVEPEDTEGPGGCVRRDRRTGRTGERWRAAGRE